MDSMFPNDPLFDGTAVLNRIKNLWMQLCLAKISGDMEPLKPYFSPRLYEAEENLIREARKVDRIREDVRPAILQSSLSAGGSENGREKLVCHMLTRSRPLEIRQSSETTVAGGMEVFRRETWTLSRPLGTKTPGERSPVSVSCPGCGSPLALYKSAKCPFCGKLVPVSDFTWTVDSITVRKEESP